MAWNYRKRVRLFPGVYLNFSKSGVGTSIGPKGAKVTFGKNGTYFNTSIPGTGLYSRQKIADSNGKRNTKTVSKIQENQLKKREGLFTISNTWGCCFRWLGILSIFFLLVNLIQFIFGYYDNSKNNIDAIEGAVIIAAIFVIVYLPNIIDLISRVVVFFKIKRINKLSENLTQKRDQSQEAVNNVSSEAVKKASSETVRKILKDLLDDSISHNYETASQVTSNAPAFNNEHEKERQTNNHQATRLESGREPLEELQTLIGLSEVKTEVSALVDFVKIQQARKEQGLKTVGVSYHCVFTGNPGTGKTTVARILAEIYRNLGVLKTGHLVETDRSGLVAEYVGQTAVKTNKIIDSALDGILFIDEAYSLAQGGNNDYGQEAISTLLKRMEDNRDRLVVVLAGYPEEIKKFINSNPGLESRFSRYIHFSDYSAEELKQIFLLNARNNQYTIDEKGLNQLEKILDSAIQHKDKSFGNGRFVRNLFEKTIQNQAIRLTSKPSTSPEELMMLTADDLPLNFNRRSSNPA